MHLRVELIDSASRRPIKTWRFAEQVEITLGRACERDIEVTDPYVSRHHASLQLRDDTWYLVAFGRNGVLVAGNSVQETVATDAMEFRLGALGPEFRFFLVPLPMPAQTEEALSTETFHMSQDMIPSLLLSTDDIRFELDHQRLEREVNDVVETDYFQRLQTLSKQLRKQRRST